MPRRRSELAEVGQELNLVPYLDIMVNLVIFMLLNITGFLSFTILNASIPQLSTNPSEAIEQLKGKELLLMVRLMDNELVLDPNVQGGPAQERRVYPNLQGEAGTRYDFESLKKDVERIKADFPDERRVLIFAKPTVVYEHIIKAMDTLRDKAQPGDGELFPDVTLSVL